MAVRRRAGGVIGAGVATALMFTMGDGQDAFFGMVRSDWTALLAYLIILFAAALGILFSPDYLTRRAFAHHGEYYALLLLSDLRHDADVGGGEPDDRLRRAGGALAAALHPLRDSAARPALAGIGPEVFPAQLVRLGLPALWHRADLRQCRYLESCRDSRLRDRESIQPHQRLWSDTRRRHWPDGGGSRLQGQRRAVPGVDAGCLRRRASSSDGLHVGGDEGRGVRRHGAHLPRRASARSRRSGSRSSGR